MFPWALKLCLASAAGLILTSGILAAFGRKLRPGEVALTRARMRERLLWGFVYANPDDPRGWVPKYSGPGWTVNARSRIGAIVMIFWTLATVIGVLLTVISSFDLLRGLR